VSYLWYQKKRQNVVLAFCITTMLCVHLPSKLGHPGRGELVT